MLRSTTESLLHTAAILTMCVSLHKCRPVDVANGKAILSGLKSSYGELLSIVPLSLFDFISVRLVHGISLEANVNTCDGSSL